MTRPKSPPTVLLVDDSKEIVDIYGELLTDSGYRVVAAYSGVEALEQAQTQAPDLIVLDLKMPGLDGFETTRRLKADRRTRSIPVVAFSGHGLEDQARAAGCVGLIAKPCTADDFIAAIETHLSR